MITSIMALTAGKLSVKITDMQTPINYTLCSK